jgi:hypothetical protein
MNATLTATTGPFFAAREDGRWRVFRNAAEGEGHLAVRVAVAASRAKAEERAAKLNAAEAPATAPLEVVTLDGTETTVTVEETVSLAQIEADCAMEEEMDRECPQEDDLIETVLAAAAPAIKEMAEEVRARLAAAESPADARKQAARELAEKVNSGELTFDQAAAVLLTGAPVIAPAEKAEPMRSLWVAAAFVPIILADTAPERATLVAKVDASVPNNRGGRTVRLTRAEAEELAAIGTEIENSVNGAGRMAHSARTMRDRLAALWA